MKRILIFALIIWQTANAQEILVPFKMDSKFGLSDLKGKLVVQPKYDWISLGKQYPPGYFGFDKGEQSGIIYNKKEILIAPKGYEFYVVKDKFIMAKYKEEFDHNKVYKSIDERRSARRNPVQISSLYNLSGRNMYTENFAKLMLLDTIARFSLFIATDFEGKHGIFVFDNNKQLITEWLLKDYEKLDPQRGHAIISTINNVKFIARKDWTANEELVSFGLVNNRVKMNSKVIPKNTETPGEGIRGSEALYKGKGRPGRDPEADITISGPVSDAKMPKTIKYYTRFDLNGNEITYTKKGQDSKVLKKELILPFKTDKIKSEIFYFTLPGHKSGPQYELANLLYVEAGGKKGIVMTDSLFIKPVYDELRPVKNDSTLFFLAGLKDPQSNTLKYGTVDIYGKTIIPIIYDQIVIDNDNGSYNDMFVKRLDSENLKVTKNKKSGYLTIKNVVKLPVEYDDIYKNNLNYLQHESDFMVLKKDGKYGLLKYGYKEDILIKPMFDKKIGYYIKDYNGKKGLHLYALVNDNAQLFCYADKDGMLYYKAN